MLSINIQSKEGWVRLDSNWPLTRRAAWNRLGCHFDVVPSWSKGLCFTAASSPPLSSVKENEATIIMCGWRLWLHPKHLGGGMKWKQGELHNFLKSPHYPICQEAMHTFLVRATMFRISFSFGGGGGGSNCWEAAKTGFFLSPFPFSGPSTPRGKRQCECCNAGLQKSSLGYTRPEYNVLNFSEQGSMSPINQNF